MVTGILLGLVLTLAPEKPEVKLGEPVVLHVTLANDGKEPYEGPGLALDARSVTLTVGEGARQFVYQQKNDDPPAAQKLEPAGKWEAKIEYTPIVAGKLPIEANYAGKASAETAVEVAPAAGAREIGVRLETTKGPLTIRFFPEVAPNTAAHFAERVRTGFYDGLVFHRVIRGFMAQGGDPQGNGQGGPGYTLPAEFTSDPKYSHTFGRLSMARTPDPDSAGSQFFICFERATFLDGKYTVFGEVSEGKETVEKIEAIGAERDPQKPKEIVKITKAVLVPLPPRG